MHRYLKNPVLFMAGSRYRRCSAIFRRAGLLGVAGLLAVLLSLVTGSVARAAPACTIKGTPGPDVLHGTPGRDVICGGGGADVISGLGGNDVLIGGPGADVLNGGPGNDVLSGGPGDDRLNGGTGSNTLIGGNGLNSCSGAGSGGSMQTCDGDAAPTVPGLPGSPTAAPGKTSEGSGEYEYTGAPIPPGPWPPPCTAAYCHEIPVQVDTEAPSVLGADFDQPFVSLTGGPGTMHFSAWVFDELSGVKSVAAEIEGPEGFWKEVELSYTGPEGKYGATFAVPADTRPGVYRLASLHVADNAGNSESMKPAEIKDSYVHDRHFTVFDGPDEEGPTISDFSISPRYVDTASGPATIDFEADVEDLKAGLRSMTVYFELPGNPVGSWERTGTAWGFLEADADPYQGRAVATLKLPKGAPAGVYRISSVEIWDMASNPTKIEGKALESLSPTTFETSGPGDSTPPEIVDFSISPTTVPAEGGEVEAYFHIRDAESGIGDFYEDPWSEFEAVLAPSHPFLEGSLSTRSGGPPELVSGGEHDGVWKTWIRIPAESSAGEYSISLRARDRAYNEVRFDTAEVEALGWQSTITKLP